MQLTMPSLNPQFDYPNSPPNPLKWSRARLDTFRNWRDVTLNGHHDIDAVATHHLTVAVAGMQANSLNDDGLRVSFGSAATYANLVLVLDIMNQYNVKKYWLDIMHVPTTFYAITVRPVAGDTTFPLGPCVTYYSEPPLSSYPQYQSPSYLLRFDNWVTDLWNPKPQVDAKDYPYGPPYTAPIFGPEREYLSAMFHQWGEILIPFRQLDWVLPFSLLICLIASSCLQLKRQLQHR